MRVALAITQGMIARRPVGILDGQVSQDRGAECGMASNNNNDNVKLDVSPGIVIVEFESAPTLEDFKDAVVLIAENHPNQPRLWDLRGGTSVATDDLKELALFSDKVLTDHPKMAIVAGDALSFGMSRMYEMMSDDDPERVRVFDDRSRAEDWLKQ